MTVLQIISPSEPKEFAFRFRLSVWQVNQILKHAKSKNMKSKSIQFPSAGRRVGGRCPVASLSFFPAPFCGPYGNECAGFLLLSVIALLYFVSGRKTDANQQAASQIRQKQVSPFCPACPGYPAIPLPTHFHPYFLLAYRTYLQSACRDE